MTRGNFRFEAGYFPVDAIEVPAAGADLRLQLFSTVGDKLIERSLAQRIGLADVREDYLPQLNLKLALLTGVGLGANLFQIKLRDVADQLDIIEVRLLVQADSSLRTVS